jgi:hypothetical protein
VDGAQRATTTVDDESGAVSVRQAIRRSAFGLLVGLGYLFVMSWLSEFNGLMALLPALALLHRRNDRRAQAGIIAAAMVAVPTTIGAAVIFKGWMPQPWSDIAFASVGALAGSILYSYVTSHRSEQATTTRP